MLINNRVIQIIEADVAPNWPPDPRRNSVVAKECLDETVMAGMYYNPETDTYYNKQITIPPSQEELLQAEMLLNQCDILINQENSDAVLAQILLNQMEGLANV